jgi:hypothetical protein
MKHKQIKTRNKQEEKITAKKIHLRAVSLADGDVAYPILEAICTKLFQKIK